MRIQKTFNILFAIILTGCTNAALAQPTMTPTLYRTKTPVLTYTPRPTVTPTHPPLPEGVGDMVVYNYDSGEDETISPTYDEDMATWVWKNEKGEVRRFLDKETGHIFSQTEQVDDRLVYQIDTFFGWEADLTQVDPNFNPTYERIGHQYLHMIDQTYPGVLTGFDENTKVIFKIGQDDFDNVIKKPGISQIIEAKKKAYFWPVYDKNHNTYTLATYVEKDANFLAKNPYEIVFYTRFMLNYCLTSDPSSTEVVGNVGGGPLKKPI